MSESILFINLKVYLNFKPNKKILINSKNILTKYNLSL